MKIRIVCKKWQKDNSFSNIRVKSDGKRVDPNLLARYIPVYASGKVEDNIKRTALLKKGKNVVKGEVVDELYPLRNFGQFGEKFKKEQLTGCFNDQMQWVEELDKGGFEYTQWLESAKITTETLNICENDINIYNINSFLTQILHAKGFQGSSYLYNKIMEARKLKNTSKNNDGMLHITLNAHIYIWCDNKKYELFLAKIRIKNAKLKENISEVERIEVVKLKHYNIAAKTVVLDRQTKHIVKETGVDNYRYEFCMEDFKEFEKNLRFVMGL